MVGLPKDGVALIGEETHNGPAELREWLDDFVVDQVRLPCMHTLGVQLDRVR